MEQKKENFFKRVKQYKNKGKYGKKAFYIWITYQCVKGIATTSLIWIPLIYGYMKHKHWLGQ
jgi:hypothetical protein